ncbi:unnamed protein product [Cyprideis torosa]|uniref:Peptidase S1 domain-containing protein n=1 Tax=Cyprideis torosa TaxID=163714 RepID=A0A7R8ZWW2_9CRUS|nr:unnamed protein product [Cyprideis torosa]CAG0905652.1 unnamed protein product [Cyprideis torosa]
MNSLLFVVLSALFLDPNARAASIGNSLWSPKLSMLERLGLFRGQNQHSFPMDPKTVVTFEPEFPCPKMKSRVGNPPRSLLLKLLEKIRGPQFRIYYGVEVEEGEMPFLAAYNNDIVERATPSCTASIWTRNHIVTAAHCLGPTNPCVYVGSPNIDKAYKLQRSDLISLIQHPDFYNAPLQADFGVITTVKPLPLEEGKIQPSCLFLGDKRSAAGTVAVSVARSAAM